MLLINNEIIINTINIHYMNIFCKYKYLVAVLPVLKSGLLSSRHTYASSSSLVFTTVAETSNPADTSAPVINNICQ